MRPAKLPTSIERADAGCAVAVIEVAESDQGDRQEQENETADPRTRSIGRTRMRSAPEVRRARALVSVRPTGVRPYTPQPST